MFREFSGCADERTAARSSGVISAGHADMAGGGLPVSWRTCFVNG